MRAIVCFFLLVSTLAAQTADDSLLVKVGEGFDRDNLPEGWVVEHAGASGWTKLRFEGPKQGVMKAAGQIEGLAEVRENPIVSTTRTPNDPRYRDLWGMPAIDAPEAWEVKRESSAVVASIDTGVNMGHEDLKGNIWTNKHEIPGNGVDDDGNGYVDDVHGWDFVNEDNDPSDDNSHGSHTAGTIGAVGDNSTGVVGVCWRVPIMPLKFLSGGGSGTLADAIQALDYAVANGARISNNSWGGRSDPNNPGWLPLKEVIELAGEKGHLCVFSAGNSATDNDTAPAVNLPAAWDSAAIVSVAASMPNDQRAGFSSYGRTTVDVAAPGVAILSCTHDGGYASFQGTSMAAPHVAGLAALLAERNPSWGHAELKQRIMESVDKLADWKDLVASGGRINVARALGEDPPPPPPPPGNRAPIAKDDHYETKQGRPLFRNVPGVLENDSDPDGDTLMIGVESRPAHGELSAIPQGSFMYRPDPEFVGTDRWTYVAKDGLLSSKATVTIKVVGEVENKPPIAKRDEYIGPGPLEGNVLENDTDPDAKEGEKLVASIQGNVSHGRLSFSGRTGRFRYVPNEGFTGQDGFAYIAVDPYGGRSETTPVILKVTKDEPDNEDRVIELLEEALRLLREKDV